MEDCTEFDLSRDGKLIRVKELVALILIYDTSEIVESMVSDEEVKLTESIVGRGGDQWKLRGVFRRFQALIREKPKFIQKQGF